ncbi:MAG: hypothetical protein WC858_01310 [Parcubacteria group bacterium]|jgi:hypothetical protein
MKRFRNILAVLVLGGLSLLSSGCIAAAALPYLIAQGAMIAGGTAAGAVAVKKATETPAPAQGAPEAMQATQQTAAPAPAAKPTDVVAKAAEPNAPAKVAKLTPLPAEKTFDVGASLADARKAKKTQGLKGVMFQDRTSKAWFLEDQEGCTWKLRGGTFCKI